MKPAEFHPDAEVEARRAAAYYEGVQAGLGADFQAELDAALVRIRANPLLYATVSSTVRLCPLQRFQYSIFYVDFPNRIWIAAVGHHRRRPRHWTRRRPN